MVGRGRRPSRALAALVLALLAACGGGGHGYDPVTHVSLSSDLEGRGAFGYSTWGAAGTAIVLLDGTDPVVRVLTLKHELWHLLVRWEDHPNPEGCVSGANGVGGGYADPDRPPCPDEIAQVNLAGRVVLLSFPEDPDAAAEAAAWWNAGLGREAVVVVD